MAANGSAAPATSGAIEIRRGTAVGVLTPSTDADFDYINANLREMDRFEQSHFVRLGIAEPDSLDQLEKAWTLHLKGEIVGYVGLMVPALSSPMSSIRNVPMLSTTNVLHNPVDYVRLSKPILDYVMSKAPAWVTDFFSAPLARYAESVRWHEKVMKWHRIGEFEAYGEKAVLFHMSRKELK